MACRNFSSVRLWAELLARTDPLIGGYRNTFHDQRRSPAGPQQALGRRAEHEIAQGIRASRSVNQQEEAATIAQRRVDRDGGGRLSHDVRIASLTNRFLADRKSTRLNSSHQKISYA